MARGWDQFYGRRADVQALGRVLSRRARARCELCGASGPLRVVEVPPFPEEPDVDRAVLVCDPCADALTSTKGRLDADRLRFLAETAWSEVLPVQLASVRLLRRLDAEGVHWAREILEGLYLDPEVEALVDAG